MNYLIKILESLTNQLKTIVITKNLQTEASKKLYEMALKCLKIPQDLTPLDEVPDEVTCMSTINALHKKAFGEPIGGDASTYLGYIALRDSKKWVKVTSALAGDLIISPTGFNDAEGKKNGITSGHIGCCLTNNQIASNNSKTGLFEINFDLWTWRYHYATRGHFPIFFFRKIF